MEYEVPEELAIFMDKMVARKTLRDLYVKLPFGFRKATKCASDMEYFKRKFWTGLFEIYPELKGKNLSYSLVTQKVTIGVN